MWDVRACRCCLKRDCKLERFSEVYKRTYTTLNGLEMDAVDGYPKYICMECSAQLRKTLAFRRKCRRAFFVMKEIMMVKKQVSSKDIFTVDRKITNLESPMVACTFEITDIAPSNYYNRLEREEANLEEVISGETENVALGSDDRVDTFGFDNDGQDNDGQDNDGQDNDVNESGIDLDDVFKDLKETSSESEKEEEIAPIEPVIRNRNKNYKYNPNHKLRLRTHVLENTEIRILSPEEQKDAFERRKEMEPFNSAPFKCILCLTIHKDTEDLINHINKHNTEFNNCTHQCQVCNKLYPNAEALAIHRAKTHSYQYTCNICGLDSYTLDGLVSCNAKHPPKHAPKELMAPLSSDFTVTPLPQDQMSTTLGNGSTMPYACSVCHLEFRNKKLLVLHVNSRHRKPRGKFICDVCGGRFLFLTRVAAHMKTCHSYVYKCKQCPAVLRNRFTALRHREKMHTKFTELACAHCDQTFRTNHQKNSHHLLKHHPHCAHCPLCGAVRVSQVALYRHQLLAHEYICLNDFSIGDPAHRCSHCDVQFQNKAAYETHVIKMYHEEVKQIEFFCTRCRKILTSEEELRLHLCRNANQGFPRACLYCGEMQSSRKQYRQHHQARHAGNPKYSEGVLQCQYCGVMMVKTNYAKHLRKCRYATNIDPYYCPFCNMKIINAKLYISHMLWHHTFKPYMCAACPARFTHRVMCRDHILKVHAPCLPYECEECGRRFSHQDFLNSHSVKAHGKNIKKELAAKHAYLSRRMKGGFYVYPLMKIDASFIDSKFFDELQVELCDYMDQNETPVDYRDYVVVDTTSQPVYANKEPSETHRSRIKTSVKRKHFTDKEIEAKKSKKEVKDDRNLVVRKNDCTTEHTTSDAGMNKADRAQPLPKINKNVENKSKPKKKSVASKEKVGQKSKKKKDDRDFVVKGLDDTKSDVFNNENKTQDYKHFVGKSLPENFDDFFSDDNFTMATVDNINAHEEHMVVETPVKMDLSNENIVMKNEENTSEKFDEELVSSLADEEKCTDEVEMDVDTANVAGEIASGRYEVIQQDGEEFVIIDGVLYKIQEEM